MGMKGDPEFVILKYSAWLDASKFEDRMLGAVIRYVEPRDASAQHHTTNLEPANFACSRWHVEAN